jgi:predicted MFS family arabinose efflux permease
MIVLAKDRMHASPGVIGLIFSLAAIGGLVGSGFAPWVKAHLRLNQIVVGCITIQALLTPLLAIATTPWMLALSWGLLFMIDPIFYASSITYRLSVTPDTIQSRVQSVFRLLSYGAEPVGMAAGGLLMGIFGPRYLIWGVAAGVASSALMVSIWERKRKS